MGFTVTIPQLSRCCCGCSLRTGCYITLFLSLIIGVINICSPMFADSAETYGYVPAIPSTFIVILGLINIVITGGGLYAMYSEIPGYMMPYLAWYLVAIVITDVSVIAATFTISSVISIIIITLISCYLWLVVFSYFRVLKGTASLSPA